eukprot:CAMPEP_0168327594 /NCGR_PEP_ID=MMETSP0213-20121227/5983_1 /TAXON_ID=151035 /ORGANISM="Euplotes harpa, Strain FSP1.4" /LENGTH=134 /DNA_ID=CAMNT_0008330513 /DNA_START=30 /DNA_END=434 /DNA_ORIENTATION=+
MTSEVFQKQQSTHFENNDCERSSSGSFLMSPFNDADRIHQRERLYTFKAIPTTPEDNNNAEEIRELKANKNDDKKYSPVFRVKPSDTNHLSVVEMEQNLGFMGSITVIPPALEANQNYENTKAINNVFAGVNSK